MVQRDEYRQMVLAGTVSFPATFPQLGKLSLQTENLPASNQKSVAFLSVTESPSARVTLVRRVPLASVRAIFIPRDARQVNYADGQWLLGDEIQSDLSTLLASSSSVLGIAFVPENEPSMLNVSAGMTAGESAQYYPPLPNDPANNHYNAWPSAGTVRAPGSAASALGSCLPKALGSGVESSQLHLFDDEPVLESCSVHGGNFELSLEAMRSAPMQAMLMDETIMSCNSGSSGS